MGENFVFLIVECKFCIYQQCIPIILIQNIEVFQLILLELLIIVPICLGLIVCPFVWVKCAHLFGFDKTVPHHVDFQAYHGIELIVSKRCLTHLKRILQWMKNMDLFKSLYQTQPCRVSILCWC
jgi:hypothetical protein